MDGQVQKFGGRLECVSRGCELRHVGFHYFPRLQRTPGVKYGGLHLLFHVLNLTNHGQNRVERVTHLVGDYSVNLLEQLLLPNQSLDLYRVRHFVDHKNEIVLHIQDDFLHFDLEEDRI